MRIHEKKYSVRADQLHGHDRIPDLNAVISASLCRYTVELEEGEYETDEHGEVRMTPEQQKEYDSFADGIRGLLMDGKRMVLDEGYGEGEDELDHHITVCPRDAAGKPVYHAVLEIATRVCVS